MPKIVILTANKSFTHFYLIRKFRKEFPSVKVIALNHYQGGNFWKKVLGTTKYYLSLAIKSILFRYRYASLRNLLPSDKIDLAVQDINSPQVARFLKDYQPDLICVLGTPKISDETIGTASLILNIHGGFLPFYRGVSSLLWASYEGNYPYFACCVHQLTSQIDSGAVYFVENAAPHFFETFEAYNIRLTAKAIDRLAEGIKSGEISKGKGVAQPEIRLSKFYRHKDKPVDFTKAAQEKFFSDEAKQYKSKYPSTNKIEKMAVNVIFPPGNRKVLSAGWYIVNYHEILKQSLNMGLKVRIPSIYTTTDNFIHHLEFYSQEFEVIALKKGIALFEKGEIKDRRCLTITFDDGLASIKEMIALMAEAQMMPAVFLNTDPLIRRKPLRNHLVLFLAEYLYSFTKAEDTQELLRMVRELTPEEFYREVRQNHPGFYERAQSKYLQVAEVKKLLSDGKIEVGSHTKSHADLNIEDHKKQEEEILGAHQELARTLGSKIPYFSFPFGGIEASNFQAEYIALNTAPYYFSCLGGINKNLCPGGILRMGIHNETVPQLRKLLANQFVR